MYSRYILFAIALLTTTTIFSQNYKKIHDKAVVVDTHNDFPSASIEKKVSLDSDLLGKTHTDLARLRSGGVDVQIFSSNSFSYSRKRSRMISSSLPSSIMCLMRSMIFCCIKLVIYLLPVKYLYKCTPGISSLQ